MSLTKKIMLFFSLCFLFLFAIGCSEEQAEAVAEKNEKTEIRKNLNQSTVSKDLSGAVEQKKFFELNAKVNENIISSIKPGGTGDRVEVEIEKPVVLRGTIVTPKKVIKDGYILIEYQEDKIQRMDYVKGIIKEVGEFSNYSGNAKVIDMTGNYIHAGFIELHNHIHYNMLDLWIPTYDIYPNRDRWPNTPRYKDWKKVYGYFHKLKKMDGAITKYGEIRGLMNGATCMQGYVSPNLKESYGLCRNIDNNGNMLYDGRSKVSGSVMPVSKWYSGRPGSRSKEKSDKARSKFKENYESGKVDKYFIHLCEGIDDNIHDEFVKLQDFDLIGEHFIGIHSTALKGKDWEVFAKAGMSVVWSPLSNLILYNKTTRVKEAVENGVPIQKIAFGPDWAPSGTPGMLFEAKVVDEYNKKELNSFFTNRQILDMANFHGSVITGYEKFIGTIEVGKRADFTILKIKDSDPAVSMLKSYNDDINMVMVDGQPLYGSIEYFQSLGKGNDYEVFKVNGIDKAIDITDKDIEDEGRQTFKELMDLMVSSFEDIKNIIPLEFPDDKKAYFTLAPLYWPKYTSYENIMYLSLMGKGSDYSNNEDKKEFKKSSYYMNRDKDARDKYRELFGQTTRKKGSRKSNNYKKKYNSKNSKDLVGKEFVVKTTGVGKYGDAICKVEGTTTFVKGYAKKNKTIKIKITKQGRVNIAKFISEQ